MEWFKQHNTHIALFFLASGNIPIVYEWFTGLYLPELLYVFGIFACIGLDWTLIQQAYKPYKNIFTWIAIVASALLTALIVISQYAAHEYSYLLHAAYSIALLFVVLSEAENERLKSTDNSKTYKKQAPGKKSGNCKKCGKFYKRLDLHKCKEGK